MENFCCPVCEKELARSGGSFYCENKHCFDISKKGYVNLLLSGRQKGHGDDRLMVKARHEFLEKGYYAPLLSEVCRMIMSLGENRLVLLDSGCGEGWYTEGILNCLVENKISAQILALDVSKEALNIAARRSDKISWAVASSYKLPLRSQSCDIVVALFSPMADKEFHRVLKVGGAFITAVPSEEHLYSLKKAVYDMPYKNKPKEDESIDGFTLKEKSEVKNIITINNNRDIKNLFAMTPYYYKTSAEDQAKLDSLERLDTQAEFIVYKYIKD